MKVAILTFHNSPNNAGAVLQAWALQRVLEKLGHEVFIIDYHRKRGDKNKWWGFGSLAGVYYTVKRFPLEMLRQSRCDAFRRRHLNLTPSEYGGRVQYRDADAFITGSDQVFNPVHNEMNPDFLLDFVPSGRRRISYGASFGTNDFNAEYREMLKTCLTKFDALSVREESGALTIKNIAGLDALVALDPVLLLDADEYKPLMSDSASATPSVVPYVFVYVIGQHPDALRMALEKAKETDAKRIVVMTNARAEWQWPHKGIVRRIGIFTPADFLVYIANAAHVVTNSFHGTAFSVIFGRKFTSLRNGTAGDDRMATLLKAKEARTLDAMREKSISFLNMVLS